MTDAKMAEEMRNVYEVEIRSTPERIWQALTDGDTMEKFFMGLRIESDWQPGSDYGFTMPDGSRMVQGQVVEYNPPRKMVTTFQPHSPTGELIDIAESRLTWEITDLGETCKLVLVHDRLDGSNPNSKGFGDGWNMFLSSKNIRRVLESRLSRGFFRRRIATCFSAWSDAIKRPPSLNLS